MNAKFWIVWSPGGQTPPRVRHASPHEARSEAERLAALNPGHHFFVCEAVGVARKVEVLWTPIVRDEEVPF